MEANDERLETVDQLDFWVGSVQIEAQITLPEAARGVVALAYSGAETSTESYVCDLARKLRSIRLGTILIDCTPDSYRIGDFRTSLRRYLPGLLCHRLTGALARLHRRETIAPYPLGCLGLGVCAGPVIGAASRYGNLADVVVSIGGRPAEALELVDEVTAPALMLQDCARLVEDVPKERRLKELFANAHASVRVESVEPPFTDEETCERVTNMATYWFLDQLIPSPPRTPDLNRSIRSLCYGLPPSPSLMARDNTGRARQW